MAANTLSAVLDGKNVAVVDFYWANPSVFNSDQVGPYSTGANGANDYFGIVTLSVTPVPEPSAYAAVAGLGFYRA